MLAIANPYVVLAAVVKLELEELEVVTEIVKLKRKTEVAVVTLLFLDPRRGNGRKY